MQAGLSGELWAGAVEANSAAVNAEGAARDLSKRGRSPKGAEGRAGKRATSQLLPSTTSSRHLPSYISTYSAPSGKPRLPPTLLQESDSLTRHNKRLSESDGPRIITYSSLLTPNCTHSYSTKQPTPYAVPA